MTEIVLTQYSGKILGPIARFFGWIMNGIYMFFSNTFGVESIAVSIIILTMLIYLCMFPLTLKQQKFSKLSQKMPAPSDCMKNTAFLRPEAVYRQ